MLLVCCTIPPCLVFRIGPTPPRSCWPSSEVTPLSFFFLYSFQLLTSGSFHASHATTLAPLANTCCRPYVRGKNTVDDFLFPHPPRSFAVVTGGSTFFPLQRKKGRLQECDSRATQWRVRAQAHYGWAFSSLPIATSLVLATLHLNSFQYSPDVADPVGYPLTTDTRAREVPQNASRPCNLQGSTSR